MRATERRSGRCGGAVVALPAVASADTLEAAQNGVLPESVAINSIWVVVAALLVIFMQTGFAFLEIGFSRGKNVGTVVAKILTNFSIAALLYWAVGFAFAFGQGDIIGHDGFFLRAYGDPLKAFPVMGLSDATIESKWLFQFSFCAVSLAIVWGTTLERIKFGVYIIYAIVFAGLIYPIGSHWVFGGGWLQSNLGMQDFAGSTAVHLIGATGAFAVLLLLGARIGKYDKEGRPRAIPGHNMPLFGLGVLILWLGWFGFNPGSTLSALDGRFPEIALVTLLAAAAGVLAADGHRLLEDEDGRHRHGRQRRDRRARRHHRPVGLRGAVGRRAHRRDRRRDRPARRLRDRQEDRRPGRRAHRARPVPASGARWRAASSPRRGWPRTTGSARAACSTRARCTSWAPRRWASSWCSRSCSSLSFATFWRDQEDLRPARLGRGGGSRPGHLRARHVRLPGAVHPGAGAHRLRDRAPRVARHPVARPPHPARGDCDMKKIEAFIRHEAFEPIRMELLELGFPSLTISEVKGSGRQKGVTERYRGAKLTNYLRPKVKLECVVASSDLETVVQTILKHARSGSIGDGKVFVMPVEEAYRIRTGESGEETLQAHPEAAVEVAG